MKIASVSCVFLDIGGVLLTDGWNHRARKRAATTFELKQTEMEERHRVAFDTYEEGKLSLDDYLDLVVFYQKRPFTRVRFRRFMFAQSKAHPDMIRLLARLKAQHGVKVVVVSNEGRELNAHRIRTFKLCDLVDAFVSSCFVHLRKPDADIYRLALDVAQVPPERVVYLENTPLFIPIAEALGIRCVLHTDYNSTRAKLASLGLQDEGHG